MARNNYNNTVIKYVIILHTVLYLELYLAETKQCFHERHKVIMSICYYKPCYLTQMFNIIVFMAVYRKYELSISWIFMELGSII